MPPHLLYLAGAVFVTATVAVRVVRAVALRKALLDTPNERSSHRVPVPRLGGAAFMPVILVALMFTEPEGGAAQAAYRGALACAWILYLLSLADDFLNLAALIRLSVQVAATAVFLTVVAAIERNSPASGILTDIGPMAPSFWLLVAWIVGVLNIYNFMDGIDGIAGVQALTAGLAWGVLGQSHLAPAAAAIGILAMAGAAGFLVHNWPPAKIFMGDAGSTVLGFTFAVLPLVASLDAASHLPLPDAMVAGALLLWPFLADGIFTMARRLRKRENILTAHRSHLYQRLVIAGKSHRQVTLTYGALAASGAPLAGLVAAQWCWAIPLSVTVVGALFLLLWRWTDRVERSWAGRS